MNELIESQERLPAWAAPRERRYVEFGHDHGGRVLKWLAFSGYDGRALLLSEEVLDVQPYAGSEIEQCSWEESTLEEHVRKSLALDLFDSAERLYIDGSPWVPSRDQIESWLPRDADRIAYPTSHAASSTFGFDAGHPARYWLSTPGDEFHVMFVRPDGDVDPYGFPVADEVGLGVRLACRLKVPLLFETTWLPPFVDDEFLDLTTDWESQPGQEAKPPDSK